MTSLSYVNIATLESDLDHLVQSEKNRTDPLGSLVSIGGDARVCKNTAKVPGGSMALTYHGGKAVKNTNGLLAEESW